MSTSPSRPEERVSEEEKAILLRRLKTLDEDRKKAIPMDEIFRQITNQKPTP